MEPAHARLVAGIRENVENGRLELFVLLFFEAEPSAIRQLFDFYRVVRRSATAAR